MSRGAALSSQREASRARRRIRFSPSRRGKALAGFGAAAALSGVALGARPFALIGLCCLAIVVLALGAAAVQGVRQLVTVRISPSFVPAGSPAEAQVFIGKGHERLVGTMPLDTTQRGIFRDAGGVLTFTGPLGLARWQPRLSELSESTLVVHPDPRLPARLGRGTEEDWFTSGQLRGYRRGDELRRIHWKATVRRGAAMVMETPRPAPATTTILLDLRGDSYTSAPPGSLEEAVSLAAGLSMPRPGEPPRRLVTTTGSDSGPLATKQRWRPVLTSLAQARLAPGATPEAMVERHPVLRRSGHVILVTTQAGLKSRPRRISRLTTVLAGAPSVPAPVPGMPVSKPSDGSAENAALLTEHAVGGTEGAALDAGEHIASSSRNSGGSRSGRSRSRASSRSTGATEPATRMQGRRLSPTGSRWLYGGGSLLASAGAVVALGGLFSGAGWIVPLAVAVVLGQCCAILGNSHGIFGRRGGLLALALGVVGSLALASLVAASWRIGWGDFGALFGAGRAFPQALRFAAVPAPTVPSLLAAATLAAGIISLASAWLARRGAGLSAVAPPVVAIAFASAEAGNHFSLPFSTLLAATAVAGGLMSALSLPGCSVIAKTGSAALSKAGSPKAGSSAGKGGCHASATVVLSSRRLGAWRTFGCLASFALAVGIVPLAGGPFIHIHGAGAGGVVHVDPEVSLVPDLTNVSGPALFTVKSSVPDYWRLTTLDVLGGNGFVGSVPADPVHPASKGGRDVVETFHLLHLASRWLPVGGVPVAGALPEGTTWEPWMATLAVPEGEQAGPGVTYQVVARVGAPSLASLFAAKVPSDASSLLTYVPPEPEAVRILADRITAGLVGPYEKAVAIQDYLRTHEVYDLHPRKVAGSPLVAFLFDTHEGYCQQFATAFAILARMVGLPTRLAVGFTTGQPGPGGSYVVGTEDVHTWPEVYLSPLGWVRFEPTPGRGAPGDARYTGVAPTQVGTKGPDSVAPIKTATAAPLPKASPIPVSSPARPARSMTGKAPAGEGPRLPEGALALLILLLAVAAIWHRRTRCRRFFASMRMPDTPGEAVSAWRKARKMLDPLVGPVRLSATPREYALLAGSRLDPGEAKRLSELAERVCGACYGPPPRHGRWET